MMLDSLTDWIVGGETRRLRERVAHLEFAIREANDWMTAVEGIDLLHGWPKDSEPTFRATIASLIPDKWERP